MIEDLIDRYIKLRDKKAEMKAAYELSVARIDDAMEKVENVIHQHLNANGLASVGANAGTAFKSTVSSATVNDRDAFMGYVRNAEAFNLLDVRANKTAIIEFRQANNDLPPGITWREEEVIRVRRANATADQ
jgi:hypothetical protein